tara:strand:+ start:185 stop:847 length:663 start_codon:yes stop_codon:yes gene_type:complete
MNEEQVSSPTIRATDSNPKLAEALAKFQAKYCNAAVDGKGNFGAYVTLSEAELAVSPATGFGLSHTFLMRGVSENMAYVGIKLMHESGEYEFSELPIFFNKGRNPYHEMGSGVTYVRRYLLLAIYGLGQADDEADTFSRETKDNTGNAKSVSKSQAPSGKQKLTDQQFKKLRTDLGKHQNKAKILETFRKKFVPSVSVVTTDHIEFSEHEQFIRNEMLRK